MKTSISDIRKRSRYLAETVAQDSVFKSTLNRAVSLIENENSSASSIVKCIENGIRSNSIYEETLFDLFEEVADRGTESQIRYVGNLICNEWVAKTRDAAETQTYLRRKMGRITGKLQGQVTNNIKDSIAAIHKATHAAQNNLKTHLNNIQNTGSAIKNAVVKKPNRSEKNEQAFAEELIKIEEMAGRMAQCDRILENYNKISKRFNVDRIIQDNTRVNGVNDTVLEICKLLETYDIPDKNKFSLTLETAWYGLHKNSIPFTETQLTTMATDYFLSKGDNRSMCAYILENSVVVSKKEYKDDDLEVITEEEPEKDEDTLDEYEEAVYLVYEKALNAAAKRKLADSEFGLPSKKKYPMPDAEHVRQAVRFFNKVDKEDEAELAKNIKKKAKQHGVELNPGKNNRLSKYLESADILSNRVVTNRDDIANTDVNTLIGEMSSYYNASASMQSLFSTPSVTSTENTHIINTLSEASFNDLFNDFKTSNEGHKESKLSMLIRKLYTKNVDNIIDGTPNLFNYIRAIFILGTCALSPILTAIALVADLFIGLHMKRKETKQMLKCFDEEIATTNKKLSTVTDPEEKKRIKAYLKSLEEAKKKINEYYETLLTDEEVMADDDDDEEEDNNNGQSNSGDDDDDFDFDDDDDDFDWGDDNDLLEGATNKTEKGILILSKLSSMTEAISTKPIDKDMCIRMLNRVPSISEDFVDISKKYPNVLDPTMLTEALSTVNKSAKTNHMSILGRYSVSNAYEEMKRYSYNEDASQHTSIVSEARHLYNSNKILKSLMEIHNNCMYASPITEASFTNSIKLAMEKMKKNLVKASDKEKQISKSIDVASVNLQKGIENSLTSANREAVIKGSILPSASKIIKACIAGGAVTLFFGPAIAVIGALGWIGVSKKYKAKERQMVIDELETELKMCEHYINIAESKNDMKSLRKLYQIQKQLERQRQRIKYKMKIEFGQKYYDTKDTLAELE